MAYILAFSQLSNDTLIYNKINSSYSHFNMLNSNHHSFKLNEQVIVGSKVERPTATFTWLCTWMSACRYMYARLILNWAQIHSDPIRIQLWILGNVCQAWGLVTEGSFVKIVRWLTSQANAFIASWFRYMGNGTNDRHLYFVTCGFCTKYHNLWVKLPNCVHGIIAGLTVAYTGIIFWNSWS